MYSCGKIQLFAILAITFGLSVKGEVQIITRSEWGAKPAKSELTKLSLPVSRVVILHTAGADCNNEDACIQAVRGLQNFHMTQSNFDDIGYSFLIGNDGKVYEGRGWDQQGAFAYGFNADSIGIVFVGTFNKTAPTEGALNAAKSLIEQGVQLGKITENYKLFGHRQLVATNSPGDTLYNIIKEWPHWSRKVFN